MIKAAPLCLMILTLLCSCAQKEIILEPVYPARCPAPEKPDLPRLGQLSFLESGRGYALLKQRDRLIRDYISGLEAAILCYERQLEK